MLILFDGVCVLCSGLVRFLAARDATGAFRFAPLQSDAAREACAAVGYPGGPDTSPGTLLVIVHGRVLQRSDAALAIAAALPYPWRAARWLQVAPRSWRDAAYGVVARNRCRWFGQRNTCFVPGEGP